MNKEIPEGFCQCGCGQRTKISGVNISTRGLTKGKPRKYIQGHVFKSNKTVSQRFWDKVYVKGPDDCWEWTGAHDTFGYGNFWDGKRYLKAHQFAYEEANGLIPIGYQVCHTCDNPSCVNSFHFFLGTFQDNADDRESKGRGIHPKGKQNRSKLTEEDVRAIRAEYIPWKVSERVLANKYGVGMTTINAIIHHRRW